MEVAEEMLSKGFEQVVERSHEDIIFVDSDGYVTPVDSDAKETLMLNLLIGATIMPRLQNYLIQLSPLGLDQPVMDLK